jgi:hypothetical protein
MSICCVLPSGSDWFARPPWSRTVSSLSVRLTIGLILAWADSHRQRTGAWPTSRSGPIPEAPGERWWNINEALRRGFRGFPGGDTLPRLLARRRRRPNPRGRPPLTIAQILAWADAHKRRTGRLPHASSGFIAGTKGLTWRAVNLALRNGHRGLPGGSSLSRLLAEHHGPRTWFLKPPLTIPQVLAWAEAHKRRTGRWPSAASGPILEAPGETWAAVNAGLAHGVRGLPAGSSLSQLLRQRRMRKSG